MPGREALPGTLKRSPKKAQETWIKTHDSAAETYGDGERAHRTAFSAVKHSFEKVGDHWEPKDRQGTVGSAGGEGRSGGTARLAERGRRRRVRPHAPGAVRPRPRARREGP